MVRLLADSRQAPLEREAESLLSEKGRYGESMLLSDTVRFHIARALEQCNYNRSQTARLLGIPYSTLQGKMKKLGLVSSKSPRHEAAAAAGTMDEKGRSDPRLPPRMGWQ
jgi:DNA-binding NtrC family response regulator